MKDTMTLGQAAVIAVHILQHKYRRRGLDFEPKAMEATLAELHIELGYRADFINNFFFLWIAPAVINIRAPQGSRMPQPDVTEENIGNSNTQDLAVKLVARERIELSGIGTYITKLHEEIMVVKRPDLVQFYLGYILPLKLLTEFPPTDKNDIHDLGLVVGTGLTRVAEQRFSGNVASEL